MRQATIAHPVECAGTGLHSGQSVLMKLLPAPAESGIRFVRTGPAMPLPSPSGLGGPTSAASSRPGASGSGLEVSARIDRVSSSARATVLASSTEGDSSVGAADATNAFRVSTVEHLLACLYMQEIDNLRVELTGDEIPALDGSAAPLFDLVEAAGRTEAAANRKVIELDEPIEIREDNRWIRAEPSDALEISYAIDFEHPAIGRQRLDFSVLDAAVFRRELASARTFGFEHEVAKLQATGFGLGGSLENTVVLGSAGVLNEGGLRFPDEFVRHKIIDLIGDLSLLGVRLNAKIEVERGGHALHHRLVRAIASSKIAHVNSAAAS